MCSQFDDPTGREEPRPFRVKLADIEGPAWWREFPAYGPNDARNLAVEYARDAGEDVRVIRIEEAA